MAPAADRFSLPPTWAVGRTGQSRNRVVSIPSPRLHNLFLISIAAHLQAPHTSVCFQREEWQALTHVLRGHMTVALDRQGVKQNAPVLALPASHSTEIGCLPVQPHLGVYCFYSLEYMQMRFSIEPPAGDRGIQESLLTSLFPWSLWHCMATLPSVRVNSKPSRK